jgi:two-component system LytT family sensor kinase
MRKRLFLFLVIFIALYILLHIAYHLPVLISGRAFPKGILQVLLALPDLILQFLSALIPYLLLHRHYPKHTWLMVLITLACIPVIMFINYEVTAFELGQQMRLRKYFLDNVFYSFIYVLYAVVFFFIRYAQHKELQQKDMELLNRQSELSFLRSQINPHFLFNSLNNIYSLMYQNAAGAQEAILGLSDLLRYMLYDASEKVALQKEIDYMTRYIALQRIRFEHPIHAALHITGPAQAVEVPPLLLIPFVENAFKHGDFTGSETGVDITVHAGNKNLYFHCTNKKGNGLKDATGGIGLKNVQRRLDLLYANRYSLKIEEDNERFTVNLELTHE